MKKLVLAILVPLLSSTLLVSGSFADLVDADESFATPNDVLPGQHNVLFTDQATGELASMLVDQSKTYDKTVDPTCKSLSDKSCTSENLSYQALIPVCQSTSDINCIVSISAKKEDGTELPAEFSRYFPLKAQNAYEGSLDKKLPTGATSSLFTIPGAPHNGGNQYLATVYLAGNVSKQSGASLGEFSARITPVQLQTAPMITGSCGVASCPDAGWAFNERTPSQGWRRQGPGFDGSHSCAATSVKESLCAQRFGFPDNLRFSVKIRLNLVPTGWMHGRIADPIIDIAEASGITTISVDAIPVRVPIVYKSNLWSELPADIKSAYSESTGQFLRGSTGGFTRIDGGGSDQADPLKRNYTSTPTPSGEGGLEELKTWLPFVKDKATASPSMWSVRTLDQNEAAGANNCFKSGSTLTGIVTTNSTQYAAGPPVYDKTEGSLVYKVAAPHFDSKGAVFKGRYSLVLRSDVARCIYGFSKAPIKAELSIVSADGSPQVATVIVSESNGWLRLRADNFEFSSPTVKVKLSQEAEPKVEVTESPVVSPVAKKSSITCVKGKLIKKVTAINPKCPAGYKKKA
jgi:hypothetical protein